MKKQEFLWWMNSSHQAFSWIPPSKIYFLKTEMLIFLMKSWTLPDVLRYVLRNYLPSKIVMLSTRIANTEPTSQQSLVCFEHPKKNKQNLTNAEQLHEWNSSLLWLMLPPFSLWNQCDFSKYVPFSFHICLLSSIEWILYMKCLVHCRINLFLISSWITQCLILPGLLPTGTWQQDPESASSAG